MLVLASSDPAGQRLVARDDAVVSNGSFQKHSSSDIFAANAGQLNPANDGFDSFLASAFSDQTGSYLGHTSNEIADAVVKYVSEHQEQGWVVRDCGEPGFGVASASARRVATRELNAAVGSAQFSERAAASAGSAVFSLSDRLEALKWIRIILCIAWIVSGLLLVFFGWASYFWGHKLGAHRQRIDKKASPSRTSTGRVRDLLFSGPSLAGGVGGAVTGFLSVSFFALVVACGICAEDGTSVSSAAFFVIWLLPGLLGAALGGHFAGLGRVFAGLSAGPCSALILTAMFGIHTLVIRVVILSVLTTLLTGPLLVPRWTTLHLHIVNACTSIVGMVAFLDGVALFAPPRASSAAWLDLWVVLFAVDESASLKAAIRMWGTSAFKGYIAGAVLGAVIGSVFELFLHRRASQDPESEWNDYLGSYTQRFEHSASALLPGSLGGNGSIDRRAGSFEPLPSAWSRIGAVLAGVGGRTRPASYGNIKARVAHDVERSPLTERAGGILGKGRRSSGHKARKASTKGGPARFSALAKRDLDSGESDTESTEYDSDDRACKQRRIGKDSKAVYASSNPEEGAREKDDLVSPLAQASRLSAGGGDLETHRGYALTRPPSYRTDSQGGSSTLSGTTARSDSVHDSRLTNGRSPSAAGLTEAKKPFDVYRDGDASASPATKSGLASPSLGPAPTSAASGNTASVPATPSLLDAIGRIQAAQAQAKAWHEAQRLRTVQNGGDEAPYGVQPASPSPRAAQKRLSKVEEDDRDRLLASNDHPEDGEGFDDWWRLQVDHKTVDGRRA